MTISDTDPVDDAVWDAFKQRLESEEFADDEQALPPTDPWLWHFRFDSTSSIDTDYPTGGI